MRNSRIGVVIILAAALIGSAAPAAAQEDADVVTPQGCFGQTPTIIAEPGVETVGTEEADVILGTAEADVIDGLGGNDRICAGEGDDVLSGGDGNDRISGGPGADTITGDAGRDRLSGDGGDDELDGGTGVDVCAGGAGFDWLPGCNDKRATRGRLVIAKNTKLKGPHKGTIVIVANRVTLDCAGNTVAGRGTGFGIRLEGRRGVTIKNCDVTRFGSGIALSNSDRNRLDRNRTRGNAGQGVSLFDSDKNRITSSIADDNGFGRHATFGFQLEGTSSGNVLNGNVANDNGETNIGVEGPRTKNNTVRQNDTTGGKRGFTARGSQHTFEGNTAIGIGEHGFESEANKSTFSNNTVDGSTSTGFRIGGTGNTVTGNASHRNGWVGFEDYSVPGVNEYAGNTCVENVQAGSSPPGLCDVSPPAVEPGPEIDETTTETEALEATE